MLTRSLIRIIGRVDAGASVFGNRFVPVTELAPQNEAGDSATLTADGAPLLDEVHKIKGLDPGNPLQVSATGRTAGSITQTAVESPPGTVTVTRS